MKLSRLSFSIPALVLLCAVGLLTTPGCDHAAGLKGRTSSAGGAAGSVTSQTIVLSKRFLNVGEPCLAALGTRQRDRETGPRSVEGQLLPPFSGP